MTYSYASKQECSLQEAVSCLIFCRNYSIYQHIYIYIYLKLPEDSTDIHKRNMVNRYQIRPYEDIIYKLCYALFLK